MLNVVSVSNFPSAIRSVYEWQTRIHFIILEEHSGELCLEHCPVIRLVETQHRSDSSSYPQFIHGVAQTCTVETKGEVWYDCHLLKTNCILLSASLFNVRASLHEKCILITSERTMLCRCVAVTFCSQLWSTTAVCWTFALYLPHLLQARRVESVIVCHLWWFLWEPHQLCSSVWWG